MTGRQTNTNQLKVYTSEFTKTVKTNSDADAYTEIDISSLHAKEILAVTASVKQCSVNGASLEIIRVYHTTDKVRFTVISSYGQAFVIRYSIFYRQKTTG